MVEGNPGKRPFNPAEADVVVVKVLEPPDWFDEPRRVLWKQVCDELASMKGLSPVDRQMIIFYVDTLAEGQRLAKKMIDIGDSVMTLKDKDGKPRSAKTVPYFTQLLQVKQIALRFAHHFGMTPAARARIVFLGNGKDPGDDDPFAC